MRILHLSDFHYKSKKYDFDINKIIGKLIVKIKEEKSIDLVLFTGDFVYNGSIPSDFENAYNILIKELIKELNIDISQIIMTPGNHDIDRTRFSKGLLYRFESEINNEVSLNEFYNNKDNDSTNSIYPSDNYNKFINKYFISDQSEHNDLFSVHLRDIDKKQVGIVSINSGWLSSEHKSDFGNLYFPTDIIKKSLIKIKDAEFKILMIHHPLSFFKEFNYFDLQDLIHKNFHLLLAGHAHRETISSYFCGNNGIACFIAQSTLSFGGSKDDIGFSILNYDFNAPYQIVTDRYTYLQKTDDFIDIGKVEITIPCGAEKEKQNKLRSKVTRKFKIELDNANLLLLHYKDSDSLNFIESFTPPVLSYKSDEDSSTGSKQVFLNYEDLIKSKDNIIFYGKDKCGKTSLLKKAQLFFLNQFSLKNIVPFYFDYKEHEYREDIDFIKLITGYYEINRGEVENLLNQKNIIFLLDNINTNILLHDEVIDFIIKNEIQFFACSEYITSRIFQKCFNQLNYDNVFFKNLRREEIRVYTDKQKIITQDSKDQVVERIVKFCKQLRLPLNYWTASLLIWIYKKFDEDFNKNLFSIIEAYIDEILKKKELAIMKGPLKFEQYKEICTNLAYKLFIDHELNVFSAGYEEIISIMIEHLNKNPRFVGDVRQIFNYLLETGIIKEIEEKDKSRYTFRLNGVFEYFLASYISENKDFIEKLLIDDSKYLAFKNELELYSGFNRKDEKFVEKIYAKTRTVFNSINDKYSKLSESYYLELPDKDINKKYGDVDNYLINKIGEADDFSKEIKKLRVNNPLSFAQQDNIEDNISPLDSESDVKPKMYFDTSKKDFELIERYLSIFARVYKNSDGIKNIALIYEIFDFLLDSYLNLGFFLVEQIEQQAKKENLNIAEDFEDDNIIGEEIIKTISKIIPVLVGAMIYDGIGHPNLTKIINDKISELKKDKNKNQYKLFILYFLLMDINLQQNKSLIDEVFNEINMGVLKTSTLFKLNYYLAFKAYKNKEIESFIKKKIQQAHFRLDSKTDIDEVNRFFSKSDKQNIIRSQNFSQ